MKIDIAQIAHKTRSFRVKANNLEKAGQGLLDYGAQLIAREDSSIIVDLDENTTPVELADYLSKKDIRVDSIEIIAESEKELRRTLLGW
jgi:hypothetical protein